MNNELLTAKEALETSITPLDDAPLGPGECALCTLFYFNSLNCNGCPIKSLTGRGSCIGTDYEQVVDAHAIRDEPNFRLYAESMLASLKEARRHA